MAGIAVLLIVLGCIAYQFFKGSLVKSFVSLIIVICSSTVAFGYFEMLANIFINKGYESKNANLVPWAQPLSFLLLFVLVFAILHTIAGKLNKKDADFGTIADSVGRCVFGLFLGLILSGLLLTILAMAPIPAKYPYNRFDPAKPDTAKPKKALLNADGFATGWFNTVSAGSFSGKKSFATIHPSFIDQAYLNRISVTDNVTILSKKNAIDLPKKDGFWPAPDSLKDTTSNDVASKSGHQLTIVRVGLTKDAIADKEMFFIPAQVRLICKDKATNESPYTGISSTAYPIGYISGLNQLQLKRLDEKITMAKADLNGKVKWIDFAFYVPNNSAPTFVQFKQNAVALLGKSSPEAEVLAPSPFIQMSKCATDKAELEPVKSATIFGVELATGQNLIDDLNIGIKDANEWNAAQSPQSPVPAVFEQDEIVLVSARLQLEKPKENDKPKKKKGKYEVDKKKPTMTLRRMLAPLGTYEMVSLKCNNPATGKAVSEAELPSLVELSGKVHRPVGVVVTGMVGDNYFCEVNYCGLVSDSVPNGLTIGEDEAVSQSLFKTVSLPSQADSIDNFYVLYLVKPTKTPKTIIIAAQTGQEYAGFKKFEGYYLK